MMAAGKGNDAATENAMDFNKLTVAEVKQLAAMAANFLGGAPVPNVSGKHIEKPVVVWTEKRGVIFGAGMT